MCKHEWVILSEVSTESKLEQLKKVGGEITASGYFAAKDLTDKKLIQTLTCKRCGKLQQFVIPI